MPTSYRMVQAPPPSSASSQSSSYSFTSASPAKRKIPPSPPSPPPRLQHQELPPFKLRRATWDPSRSEQYAPGRARMDSLSVKTAELSLNPNPVHRPRDEQHSPPQFHSIRWDGKQDESDLSGNERRKTDTGMDTRRQRLRFMSEDAIYIKPGRPTYNLPPPPVSAPTLRHRSRSVADEGPLQLAPIQTFLGSEKHKLPPISDLIKEVEDVVREDKSARTPHPHSSRSPKSSISTASFSTSPSASSTSNSSRSSQSSLILKTCCWASCSSSFHSLTSLAIHAFNHVVQPDRETRHCRWNNCGVLHTNKRELLRHLDTHLDVHFMCRCGKLMSREGAVINEHVKGCDRSSGFEGDVIVDKALQVILPLYPSEENGLPASRVKREVARERGTLLGWEVTVKDEPLPEPPAFISFESDRKSGVIVGPPPSHPSDSPISLAPRPNQRRKKRDWTSGPTQVYAITTPTPNGTHISIAGDYNPMAQVLPTLKRPEWHNLELSLNSSPPSDVPPSPLFHCLWTSCSSPPFSTWLQLATHVLTTHAYNRHSPSYTHPICRWNHCDAELRNNKTSFRSHGYYRHLEVHLNIYWHCYCGHLLNGQTGAATHQRPDSHSKWHPEGEYVGGVIWAAEADEGRGRWVPYMDGRKQGPYKEEMTFQLQG